MGVLVELVPSDPRWKDLFEDEARRIRQALGSAARLIEHVGSTAVPGLAAKPIVDVVLEVADTTDEEAYVPHLEHLDYEVRLREPDWYQHRLLIRVDPAVNLHVFSEGCEETDRMIVFRDRLRESPEDRERYSRLKFELVQVRWPSVQDYANAKSELVEAILAGNE